MDSLPEVIEASLKDPLVDRDHFMSVAVDEDKGSFTMYDDRFTYRANNAWIHDGILSEWARVDQSRYVKDIPIQHMERSNMNIFNLRRAIFCLCEPSAARTGKPKLIQHFYFTSVAADRVSLWRGFLLWRLTGALRVKYNLCSMWKERKE